MCRAMEQMRNETALTERKNIARRLIKARKLSYEEIAESVNFTLEEVKELAEEMSELAKA